MASAESAKQLIAEAKGNLLVLLQEEDTDSGFAGSSWSDSMFHACELLTEASQEIERAQLFV